MRCLGLDLGTKTLGIAISDKTNVVASFYKVLRYNDITYLINELKSIVNDNAITDIALGLPKNMNNSLGPAADRSIAFKEILEHEFPNLNIELIDERLSTVEATNYLLEADMSRKKRKKVVDGVAASIILDTYLKMKGD